MLLVYMNNVISASCCFIAFAPDSYSPVQTPHAAILKTMKSRWRFTACRINNKKAANGDDQAQPGHTINELTITGIGTKTRFARSRAEHTAGQETQTACLQHA